MKKKDHLKSDHEFTMTVRKATTYIVDENGVEKEIDPISQNTKEDSTDLKSE